MSALAPAPLTPKSGYMTPAIARESSRGTSLCTSSDESTKNGKSDGSTVCRHSATPSRAAAALTSLGEHEHYAAGDHLTTFSLDGHKCGLLICYDLRFPELFRTLALQGVELLLLPAQWPAARRYHWETLTAARAIENQLFLAACNSCGTAGETVFGGASRILGPRGELLAAAGAGEEIVTAALDFSVLAEVRNSINVFHDRRPELYRL